MAERVGQPSIAAVAQPVRVLVANEPCAYREVLAAAVLLLRPHLDVRIVAPGDVDGAVHRLAPHLVVCSRLSPAVLTSPLGWVLLYPGGQGRGVLSMAGRRTTTRSVEFAWVLDALDQTERLLQMN